MSEPDINSQNPQIQALEGELQQMQSYAEGLESLCTQTERAIVRRDHAESENSERASAMEKFDQSLSAE